MKRNVLVIGLAVVLIALTMSGCDEIIKEITSKPGTPTLVFAAPLSDTSITITWLSAFGATSYNVYSITDSNITKLGSTEETSYTHTGLTPETTYTYQVKAVNDGGESAFSASTTAKTFALADATGNSATDAIAITAAGVTGTLLRGSSELWYTFTKTGAGTLAVKDSGNSTTYTADIVVDILDANEAAVVISGVAQSGINLGYNGLNSIALSNLDGKYYVKVKSYNPNSLSGGTFEISFN